MSERLRNDGHRKRDQSGRLQVHRSFPYFQWDGLCGHTRLHEFGQYRSGVADSHEHRKHRSVPPGLHRPGRYVPSGLVSGGLCLLPELLCHDLLGYSVSRQLLDLRMLLRLGFRPVLHPKRLWPDHV